ncbi:prepilin peptidase [Trinickia sp. EG282A]|uniref:prepilin peptidase n=1 Tax=Trinickia sp. EG282A TaxID=3237013 RepID=UPI0034D357CA
MDPVKAAACALLTMLAVSDLRSRRLPNAWVAGLAALYLAEAAMSGGAWRPLATHAAAAALSFILAALLVRLGWLAGGDAKLAAAVFFWCGPTDAIAVLVIVSICGTLIALSMLIVHALVRRRVSVLGESKRVTWLSPESGVPYGVALALGGIAAVLAQPSFHDRAALALLELAPDRCAWLALGLHAPLA